MDNEYELDEKKELGEKIELDCDNRDLFDNKIPLGLKPELDFNQNQALIDNSRFDNSQGYNYDYNKYSDDNNFNNN